MKRTGTLAMCRLDNNTVLEKGLYYYQGNDFASELVYKRRPSLRTLLRAHRQ